MMPPPHGGIARRAMAEFQPFQRRAPAAWPLRQRGVIRRGTMPMPLSVQIFVLAYSAATGFVVAGLSASFYQLVTSEPARFALIGRSAPAMILSFFFCGVTGPFIIMRHALFGGSGRKDGKRLELGWLAGSVVIAAMWSTCSGLLVLDFALAARAGLG